MFPLPEWAPSVHPLIVHFPLVLPFVAVGVDVFGLFLHPARTTLRRGGACLYVVAALAAVAAYISGRAAADGVALPPEGEPLLAAHAAWAWRTATFLAAYAVVRLLREWWQPRPRPGLDVSLTLVGLLSLALLVQTGERGAQLVYEHGVGVAAAQREDARQHRHEDHESAQTHGHGEEAPGTAP